MGRALAQTLPKVNALSARGIFSLKIYIALKECAETIYWLDLLAETDYLKTEEYQSLYADCEELRKMLSSTTKTMSAKFAKGDDTV